MIGSFYQPLQPGFHFSLDLQCYLQVSWYLEGHRAVCAGVVMCECYDCNLNFMKIHIHMYFKQTCLCWSFL